MTTAAAPLKAEKTMTSRTGTPSRNVADREEGAEDQADDERDHAGPEAEELEEADAQRVADGATEDDDRGVVPEVRDRREHQAEDEADPPRQDGREEALAEDVAGPLGTGDEAEEERPDGQQDREQLEPVEGPRERR